MNILFLEHPGTNSRSIFRDIMSGFEQLGHHCLIMPLEPIWAVPHKAPDAAQKLRGDLGRLLVQFIEANAIDLTVAMWGNALTAFGLFRDDHGSVGTIFESIDHPHLMIWLDSPERVQDGEFLPLFQMGVFRSPLLFHFINNAGTAEEMVQLFGFRRENILTMDYGIEPTIFRPHDDVRREYDIVCSLGGRHPATPLMIDQVQQDEPDMQAVRHALAESLPPRLATMAEQFDKSVQPAVEKVLHLLLEIQLTSPQTPMMHRLLGLVESDASLRGGVEALGRDLPRYVSATQLIRSIESFRRAFILSYLSRYFRCAAFGGGLDLSDWPHRVESLENLEYADQARAYSLGHFGLSVMRWQDEVGLHIKPLEIAASGALPVVEQRSGIEALFPSKSPVVIFNTPAEARRKMQSLLDDPAGLAMQTAVAQQHTHDRHTWKHRASAMLEDIGRKTDRWAVAPAQAAR
jgi:hypothetical protein